MDDRTKEIIDSELIKLNGNCDSPKNFIYLSVGIDSSKIWERYIKELIKKQN